jgi:hypothetical protein
VHSLECVSKGGWEGVKIAVPTTGSCVAAAGCDAADSRKKGTSAIPEGRLGHRRDSVLALRAAQTANTNSISIVICCWLCYQGYQAYSARLTEEMSNHSHLLTLLVLV